MTQTPWGAGVPAQQYPQAQQYPPPPQQPQQWGGQQPQPQQVDPGTPAASDPFAKQESLPSLSFKDAPVGASYTGTVVSHPTMLQTRDYQTKQPETWPDGNPKMAAVFNLRLDSGEVRSVWARRPSGLFQAIQEAQERAGVRIAPGGRLTLTFTGWGQATAGNDPPKTYAATYEPGNAFAGGPQPGPTGAAPQAPAAAPAWQQPAAPPAGQAAGWAQTATQPPAPQQWQQPAPQAPPGQQWGQAQQQAGNPQDAGAAALAFQQAQAAQQAPPQSPQGGPEWFGAQQQPQAPAQPPQGQQPGPGGYTDAQIAAARAAGIALPGL